MVVVVVNQDSQGDRFGDVIGVAKVTGGKVDVKEIHANIDKSAKQNLAEAAQEIQQLLDQLSQTYPSETTSEKMVLASQAVAEMEKNLTLRHKVISALKAGSVSALEQALNHPASSFVINAVKDWRENG